MRTEYWDMDLAVEVAREEGRKEMTQKIARAMRADGMDVNTIAEVTELTVDEILRL